MKADGRITRTNWSLGGGRIGGQPVRVVRDGSKFVGGMGRPWLCCERRPSSGVVHRRGVWPDQSSRKLLGQSI